MAHFRAVSDTTGARGFPLQHAEADWHQHAA